MRQEDVPVLNDQAYLAAIYQRHAPALFAYLNRHAHAPEDTEDLLLEVFLAALERPGFAQLSESTQKAWLWRVAHNKAVDHLRKQVYRRGVSLEHMVEEQYEQDLVTPEAIMLRGEEYQRLQVHMQRLPEIQQEVVRLRFANGLKSAEIAAVLHKSEGAVRVLLSRALKLLRNVYEHEEEE